MVTIVRLASVWVVIRINEREAMLVVCQNAVVADAPRANP
jgi:hypothetical protein